MSPQGQTLLSAPTGSTAYLRDEIDVLFPKTSTTTTLTFTLDVTGSVSPGGPSGTAADGASATIAALD